MIVDAVGLTTSLHDATILPADLLYFFLYVDDTILVMTPLYSCYEQAIFNEKSNMGSLGYFLGIEITPHVDGFHLYQRYTILTYLPAQGSSMVALLLHRRSFIFKCILLTGSLFLAPHAIDIHLVV